MRFIWVSVMATTAFLGGAKVALAQDESERTFRTAPTFLVLLGLMEAKEDDGKEPIMQSDRPDAAFSSVNVPRGRLQLEMAYTYTHDRSEGANFRSHSFPELDVRYGLLEWLELRMGNNLTSEGVPGQYDSGAQDTILGLGINLTQQKKLVPESRIIVQMAVPTGASAFTADEVLPGAIYAYCWDVTEKLSFAGTTSVNRARDPSGAFYTEWFQDANIGYAPNEKLSLFAEVFGFFPSGARDADTLPEYYFDTGLSYKIRPNFQWDIRAGVGLNRRADDYFIGSGLVVRF